MKGSLGVSPGASSSSCGLMMVFDGEAQKRRRIIEAQSWQRSPRILTNLRRVSPRGHFASSGLPAPSSTFEAPRRPPSLADELECSAPVSEWGLRNIFWGRSLLSVCLRFLAPLPACLKLNSRTPSARRMYALVEQEGHDEHTFKKLYSRVPQMIPPPMFLTIKKKN